jgi:hypothetical protein
VLSHKRVLSLLSVQAVLFVSSFVAVMTAVEAHFSVLLYFASAISIADSLPSQNHIAADVLQRMCLHTGLLATPRS